jgi:multidrug efflux pump subunit AcrA (membrane-fusion protein)
MTGFFPRALLILSCLLPLAGCGMGNAPAPSAAAAKPTEKTPEKPRNEAELARTTLSAREAQSLQIETQPLQVELVQQQLNLPGWVMTQPGCEATLTAPVAGYIRIGPKGVPIPGRTLQADEVVFLVAPVLSPLEEIQLTTLRRGVENDLARAQENQTVADTEYTRSRGLRKEGLRSDQELEQARSRLEQASADLKAAKAKLELFDPKSGHLPPVPVKVPRAGTVLTVPVTPGQYVSAAAPLLTLADLSTPWLRVPIPEAELPRLALAGNASIRFRSGQPLTLSGGTLVPQVDPGRRTADLLYPLPPEARQRGLIARDQMVMVGVPIEQQQKEAVVADSALIFDAYGGVWIYVEVSPANAEQRVYERRRVEPGPALGKRVAIRGRGEAGEAIAGVGKAGERVVSQNAGLLFSREFYKPPK